MWHEACFGGLVFLYPSSYEGQKIRIMEAL